MWRLTAVTRGYVYIHLKGMVSVRRSSQWKLRNTYTDSALQQTEIVQLGSGEFLFFFLSTHLSSLTDNVDPIVCYWTPTTFLFSSSRPSCNQQAEYTFYFPALKHLLLSNTFNICRSFTCHKTVMKNVIYWRSLLTTNVYSLCHTGHWLFQLKSAVKS